MNLCLRKYALLVLFVGSSLIFQTYTDAKEVTLTDEDFDNIDIYGPDVENEVTLTDEDFANIGRYEPDEESKKTIDPMVSGKFEGDIDLNGNPLELYLRTNVGDGELEEQENAVRNPLLKWPNGVIPYTISSDFTTAERSQIAAGIRDFHSNTCIRFIPRSIQSNYVYIFKGGLHRCYSFVGMIGGRQSISLGRGCITKGIAIHEMMHASGFFHEQSRNDRDNYIVIHWNNITPGKNPQFRKYDLRMIDHLGTAYDYGSVMHYGSYAFSRYVFYQFFL